MAYRESTQFVIARMRRDIPTKIADFIQLSSAEGRFEFKNVPMGEYKVLAVGKIGDQEVHLAGVHRSPQFHSTIPST